MSEIYKLEYKRHVLRGVSGLMTVTAMKAMTMTAYQRMASSSWLAVDEQTSDLPPHKYDQTGHLDTYDAAKYCGDYANGKQKAYACAACYSIRLPEDARGDSPAKVEAIIASVYGDRWLAEGAVVSAFLSASESPPDWATIVDNTNSLASTPDPAPAIDEATAPDWQPPLRASVRSNAGPDHRYDAVVTADVPTNATAYLHIVIRLSDYISVPKITLPDATQKDSSWIEGGAAIVGTTLQVQFDRAVLLSADKMLVFANEFLTENTVCGTHYDASSEVVNLRHSAGIFYNQDCPPATNLGDAVMMRRCIAMRNVDSIAPRYLSPDGVNLGFGVCDNFDLFPGKVGVEYEKAGDLDIYRLVGVTVMRGTETDEGTVDRISFDQAIPEIPAGQVVRLSFYGASGMLPSVMLENALVPQYSAYPHAITDDFVHGEAYEFYLNVGITGGAVYQGFIDSEAVPFSTIPLEPLGHFDIDGEGLAAGTEMPLKAPWTLPRHAVIVATANVIAFTDDWVSADKTSTAVSWEPKNINLHYKD